ncbi:16S rRNA (adenine(1518)-N(6)/adenine(1519)-N(6))-dimethyltransferase RsmA [Silvibacterium sp.]|uniref:16S rRNA (adenine(1518)-N(6)/adenine(1519)-N(6))- dimethyltransferase RsmA n=1 Tax=Silvibacterium sp. TaxID=1964179 RepID=UPI0039E6F257
MSRSNHRPAQRSKPKLGQNFLIDPNASLAIADALGDLSERTVVEIGPGAGAITELLMPRARRLVAIELDRVLAQRLTEQHANVASFEVVSADVLTVDFHALRADGPPLLVIGNLPYYITSDILLHLFRYHADVDRAVIMVQREVADRVAAHPGTRDYGVLSATSQLYARVERILTLPPEAFMPPPDVHSSVLRLTMQPQFAALEVEPEAFIGFLKKAFAQKRKTLASNLRAAGLGSQEAQKALEAAGIPSMARAEELDLPTMARLWKQLPR